MSKIENPSANPLGNAPIGKTLVKFAIPAIISNLVSAVYNVTDQIFIGQGVGILGNAATNVAFPISIICTAVAILFGFGGAASFSLEMGRGNQKKALGIVGTTFGCLIIAGIIICTAVQIFLHPLLTFFGATDQIMDYAVSYVSITNIGIPFLLLSTGGSHMIRSDGHPTYSMIAIIVGAALNMILDPIFIFICEWGVAGAAAATVISQIFSAIIIVAYLPRYQSVKVTIRDLIPKLNCVMTIMSLGIAVSVNQIAILVQQVAMNNILRQYGELSIYGSEIPLASMGIINKINMIVISVVLGIAQGGQPIIGFNYGAKKYSRVRKTFRYILITSFLVSCIAFAGFQLFPGDIIKVFGSGDSLYVQFSTHMMRIYLFFTAINGCQPISANVFPALGKPLKGVSISVMRPLIFLIPLFILPKFIGLDGVAYSGPITDGITFLFALIMWTSEFKHIPHKDVLV